MDTQLHTTYKNVTHVKSNNVEITKIKDNVGSREMNLYLKRQG